MVEIAQSGIARNGYWQAQVGVSARNHDAEQPLAEDESVWARPLALGEAHAFRCSATEYLGYQYASAPAPVV